MSQHSPLHHSSTCPGELATGVRPDDEADADGVELTLFGIPKAFGESELTDRIQHNAIGSWVQLRPRVEVVLLGDEAGIRETAAKLGAVHIPGLQYNAQGTPQVDSAFRLARQYSTTPRLAYCNCDVILNEDLLSTLDRLKTLLPGKPWLAFGRRIDLSVDRLLDFRREDTLPELLARVEREGTISSQVCKEYFIFNRDRFDDMPAFAIGRGNWDNWMIQHARQSGDPVINVSECLTAIHQEHDYAHAGQSRMECYVSGEEAKTNQQLGGGRHLISGSVGTHRLTAAGLVREKPLLVNPAFWADVPRFARLLLRLVRSR